MDQTQLISQCLNGERDRDCNWCPAHPSRNGECCFSARHEYNHPDCNACYIRQDCAAMTHGLNRAPAYANSNVIRPAAPTRVYPGVRTAPSGQSVRVSSGMQMPPMSAYGPQPGEPLLVQQPIAPEPIKLSPTNGLFHRFCQVVAWGAGEGGLEMALNFFRKRRPE